MMSDVPEGYKMSEVGVIPKEWEVRKLEDLLEQSRSIRYGIVQPGVFDPCGCLMLRSQDYSKGWTKPDGMHRVNSLIESQYRNARIRSSDLIITIVGAGIGQVEVAPFWLDGAILSRSTARIAIDEKQAASEFIAAFLESPLTKRQILNCQKEGAQPVVSCRDLAKFVVPYPSLPEQTAIAIVLSDTDALIERLKKMIAKKIAIKQGAMQQLLTGKKRLPGFSGEWEVKRLGEIAEIATGNTPPTNDLNNYGNKFVFVSPADLGRSKYIVDSNKKLSKKGFNISRKFPANSILFTCIGSTIGKSGIAPIVLTSNQQINAIFPNDSYSTDYVFYTLNHLAYRIKSLASEQAVPIINKSAFEATQTPFPPLPEQQAIAQILSDMDAEIEALEQKRNKYKDIKQGMMQELLTGKTRLV
jgi:type I restriction enzyme, S subunit